MMLRNGVMPIPPVKKTASRVSLVWSVKFPKGPSILTGVPSGMVLNTRLNAVSRIRVATINSPKSGTLAIEKGNRHSADVPPELRGFDHMLRVPHAGHQHLGLKPVVPVDGHNVLNESHPVLTDIVQSADEGTDAPSASLRSQQGLGRREAQ